MLTKIREEILGKPEYIFGRWKILGIPWRRLDKELVAPSLQVIEMGKQSDVID